MWVSSTVHWRERKAFATVCWQDLAPSGQAGSSTAAHVRPHRPSRSEELASIGGDSYTVCSQPMIIGTLAAAPAGKVVASSNQHMAEVIDNAKRLSLITGATVLLNRNRNQVHLEFIAAR